MGSSMKTLKPSLVKLFQVSKNMSEIFTRAANDIVRDASLDEMFPNY